MTVHRDGLVMPHGVTMAIPHTSIPRGAVVRYRGAEYRLDLVECRRALVRRQVEGSLTNMASLAAAANISRSTASRFFSGKSTSLTAATRILDALGLTFHDVAVPVDAESDTDVDGRLPRTRGRPDRSLADDGQPAPPAVRLSVQELLNYVALAAVVGS